jgi:hypothetical protein
MKASSQMATQTVSETPISFDAAIDDATMERMEKGAQAQARGQQRRCALLATARDSATLLKLAKESPAAYEDFAGMVLDFHEFAKAEMAIAEAAFARIALIQDLAEST